MHAEISRAINQKIKKKFLKTLMMEEVAAHNT